MKREIKFRAKAIEDINHPSVKKSEWVYGYCLMQYESGRIELDGVYCDPDTFGQYTGYKDKNGREIYEGDIVETSVKGVPMTLVVEYVQGFVYYDAEQRYRGDVGDYADDTVVIGNIHENPELLQ